MRRFLKLFTFLVTETTDRFFFPYSDVVRMFLYLGFVSLVSLCFGPNDESSCLLLVSLLIHLLPGRSPRGHLWVQTSTDQHKPTPCLCFTSQSDMNFTGTVILLLHNKRCLF